MTGFDPVQYKKIEKETYSMTAEANDKYGSENFENYAKPLLQKVGIKPNQQVLDIACGTGIPSLMVAPMILPNGTVIGIDLAPGMLGIAKKKAKQKGINNVEFQEADGESLPFPNESFDVALCNHGLVHMTDKSKVLGEIKRILKKGNGSLALSVWSTPDKTVPLGIIAKILFQFWPSAIVPGAPSWFEYGPDGVLKKLLSDNGFRDIQISRHNLPMEVKNGEEYLEGVIGVSGKLQMLLKNIPVNIAENIKMSIVKEAENFRLGKLISMPCEEIIAIAKT
jgi:ubiquinone/menaquinone biosynthesis C-methylase UbiE